MYSNNNDGKEKDRIENLKNQEIGTRSNKKERRKRKDKRKNGKQRKKEKKKKGKEKKQRELVPQTCTNRLFPSLPLKILPSTKSKEKGSSRH